MSNRTVLPWALLAVATLGCTPKPVRAQTQPQRTIQRTVASGQSNDEATDPAPDAIDTMLRQYREIWRKMSTAQQKAFLDSGGSAPDQYERVLRTIGLPALPPGETPRPQAGRQSPTDPRAAVNALDSLTTSLQDLNAIRDANLSRVQKDGCPPEVTARMADLKGRLRQQEAELTGVEAPVPITSQTKQRSNATEPATIASDWYKQSPDQQEGLARGVGASSSSSDEARSNHESQLLADVLSPRPTVAASERRIDPKSPQGIQKQRALEEEIARTKTEIAQLSGACTALKQ